MSIGTKKETVTNKHRVKFQTLIIAVTIILVLLFQSVYINVNMQRLKSYADNAETEALQTYHSYLTENFQACMYEVDILRSCIVRNKVNSYVSSYMNLIEENQAEAIVEEMKQTIEQLSVSDSIVRDFIVFGENFNQENLYCDVERRELIETSFPTVDLLGKVGIDAVLHTNFGYLVKCDAARLEEVKLTNLSDSDREAAENMLEYLQDEYILCDYINETLTVIRFNKEYIEEKFQLTGQDKFIVYHFSGRPILYFNTDEAYAKSLTEQISIEQNFDENENCIYSISPNLYGKLSVVTEQEKSEAYFSFVNRSYIYIAFAGVSVLVSLFCLFLFSNKVFKKIGFLHTTIKKQTKSDYFGFMEIEEKNSHFSKLTFSKRILLTFISSNLVSLAFVTIAFHVIVEWETRELAEELGKQLSRNYANECMIHYERYNSISTVKIEKFLEEFNRDEDSVNTELTREFEENFYYETTYLPGYMYAFIVDTNNEVLYQTVFSSQKQVSGELIRNAITKAAKLDEFETNGVFVPINDLMSGKEALAFVKAITYDSSKKGTMVIVSDVPEASTDNISRSLITDYLIADKENQVLIGSASGYRPSQLESDDMFDKSNKILYSVDDSSQDYLGKCVVLTYYNFYLDQIRAIQYVNMIWMIVIGVICVIAMFLLRRVFVKPFNTLIMSMNATPENGYQQIPEHFAIDEIDAIAIAYNKMMRRLQQLVQDNVRQEAEKRELELLQAQTEFKMLEQQMNPHFLFNTLECVNLLAIKSGEKSISGIVKSLSMILRYALSKETKVKVEREIRVLQSYIEIQSFRFGDNFQVELDLDESLFEVRMIKFVLQPIVENAILHGMAGLSGDGRICVQLGCYEDGIEFRIYDNGVGMSEETLEKLKHTISSNIEEPSERREGGIGLRNVARRIALYYKGKGEFLVNSKEGEGTEVVVRLPFEMEES